MGKNHASQYANFGSLRNLFVFSKKISTNLIYYSIDNKIFYTE